jgi:hypothetical protein
LTERSFDRKFLWPKAFFRKNRSFDQKTERSVNKYILHTKFVLNIGSNYFLSKNTVGKMTINWKKLSVKHPFGQMTQISLSVQWSSFFQRNDLLVKEFSAKRRSDEWRFGQMTFRSIGVRSNVVRSNGVSVKRRSFKENR